MKKPEPELFIIIAILLALALLVGVCGGCNEAQQAPQQVWGQGSPPAVWQSWFGNGNLARLNFVQTQRIDQYQGLIYGLDTKNPDGKAIHKRGLIERVTSLESLIERVKKLEDTEKRKLARWEKAGEKLLELDGGGESVGE